MHVQSIKRVYFSPTGTTKRIVEEIANSIDVKRGEVVDCTKPTTRAGRSPTFHDELVILGCPVYYGRVPVEVTNYFTSFTVEKTPVVLVVVYGNREYDDSLKELYDIAVTAGFTPVAGGAFIGEHSLSSERVPIAHGRPDTEDYQKAQEFGAKIQEKLHQINHIDEIGTLNVPGNRPYRKIMRLPKITPSTRKNLCTQCGKCAELCPTAAISRNDIKRTDKQKCLLCFACIKTCPSGARVMRNLLVKSLTKILSKGCQRREEPEIYL